MKRLLTALVLILVASSTAAALDVAELLFPVDAPPPEGDCARLVEAAVAVTETLRERDRAIASACKALEGSETRFELATGTVRGVVSNVADDSAVVSASYLIDGARRTKPVRVTWSDLSAAQCASLARAGGWKPEPAESDVAEACLAFALGDYDAAGRAVESARNHLLAPRLRTLLAHARADRSYRAAIGRARDRLRVKDWKGASEAAVSASIARPGDTVATSLLVKARYAASMQRALAHARRRDWKPAIEAAREALAAKTGDEAAARLLDEATTALRSTTMLTLELAAEVSLELVYVKPGSFVMGGKGDPEVSWEGVRKPEHEVEITRGLYMGTYEVTRAQFAAFVEATGHVTTAEKEGKARGRRVDGSFGDLPEATWRDTTIYTQTDDHPVTTVSWFDCRAFCAWASEVTGRDVRLPTEAEWEFACKAGTNTWYFCGDDESHLRDYCWFSPHAAWKTHPVGEKKPNAWGLYDMHGNVYEWVADWYDETYYERSPRKDPPGPARGNRGISRGGGWHGGPFCCGSHIRRLEGRIYREPDLGFRVAVTAPAR